MKYISVFCGSSSGNEKVFTEQARLLGQTIARRGYGVVYGGAHVGLMGAVASGALSEGGEVIGVIPEFLKKKELEYKNLTQMYVVDTMHERKAKMNELSDAVIALPGGYGTMEELFEILTWGQLALHRKPVGLLDIDGFYEPLIAMSEKMIEKGFLKEEYRDLLIVDDKIDLLLKKMEAFVPLINDKWFEVT
ncbi:hypothetical protein GGR21_001963 [Dysgonomonas hofstadii]|uniref:Cytokinin riboside 5'-monophosphate phosphoribohydrolase n=1 Tax=Dysgonomonas hofstadii TaxID=637886 RepID=A0A840CU83_9BACT|nr:TIGR00730 family Rossman fold protein [Dysgonomonas hofstadii]MBB4036062.1 hypothetical protein [Dysgonomonas hofstadii]